MRFLILRSTACAALTLFAATAAHAQWAVVDVGAIARLVQQLNTMQEQLQTARNQLNEQRAQYSAR